jgi:hypothetical protein
MVLVRTAEHAAPQAQRAQRTDGALWRIACLAVPVQREQPVRRRRLHLHRVVLRAPRACRSIGPARPTS